MNQNKSIRIGGASGYWGDYNDATSQLLAGADVDYLVYDYLAEITLSIMARARAKDTSLGYATDFVSSVLKRNLAEIARQNVKVITNAGGVNPLACADAVRELIAAQGLDLTVAVVTGDDLSALKHELKVTEMFSGDAFPAAESIASINAYLGAFPIATALDEGADIVITGRCVDSAVTLGACIHAFCWQPEQWDLLAAGTLAGHLIECGTQVTGGNFTDWELVSDSLDAIGYPVADVSPDGSMIITKAEGTGGMVSEGTVCEQLLYEIGDPQAYIVADVVCDFSKVRVQQQASDCVRVSGARGYPATDSYKVSATFADGWRGGAMYTVYGIDADNKASCFAQTCLQRASRSLSARKLPELSETSVEILGAESQFGAAREISTAREVVVKIAARHPEAAGVAVLLKEIAGLGLSAPPGLCVFAGTRPKPSPVVRLFSFLWPKNKLTIQIQVGDRTINYDISAGSGLGNSEVAALDVSGLQLSETVSEQVPLLKLAYARSGDKGNKANIGVIARKPEYLPFIWAVLDEAFVGQCFEHFIEGDVTDAVQRFYLPGSHAINLLIDNVLGGGGMASLRNDAQGKGFAQLLLARSVPVNEAIARAVMESDAL